MREFIQGHGESSEEKRFGPVRQVQSYHLDQKIIIHYDDTKKQFFWETIKEIFTDLRYP